MIAETSCQRNRIIFIFLQVDIDDGTIIFDFQIVLSNKLANDMFQLDKFNYNFGMLH